MADFIELVRSAMEDYFGDDRRRIEHALRVAEYSVDLMESVGADSLVSVTAAYLHDIGIPEAERKYNSSAGGYQEKEGPPVARAILLELGAEEAFIKEVCGLVGAHHTPAAIDSPEFRVLWDADALVNLEEILEGKSGEKAGEIIEKWMVTERGRTLARSIYLS